MTSKRGGSAAAGLLVAAAGLAAAGLLVAAALAVSGPGRVHRGLYDGVSPLPPYQWVHPPRELARDNRPPQPGRATRDLDPGGRSPGAVATGDAQCTVIFNEGSVFAGPQGRTITATITPLDPASIAPAPAGTRFDGNACRFEAVYGKTGTEPQYRRPVTVILRYASGGAQIAQAVPGPPPAWELIRTQRYAGHLQLLVADVPALGTFAPVAPAGTPYTAPTPWATYAVAVAAAVFVALLLLRRRRHAPLPRGGAGPAHPRARSRGRGPERVRGA
jgi:hypothetical protein